MTFTSTNFKFSNQTNYYSGKVRDVYTIMNDYVVMIATDRISAFDVILPKGIPCKGQVLNETAKFFLELTKDICPNWLLKSPHPLVSIGKKCDPIRVEMVIRGHLAGHAFREYHNGVREICGVKLEDGLKLNDKLPKPIITPTTKEDKGHDRDISPEEILELGLVGERDWKILEDYTYKLFEFGSKWANERGLILADTKYEFGISSDGEILLIDEVHTPDSSRYFILDGFDERQKSGQMQEQLSKEFVRMWLLDEGFWGEPNQVIPEMTDYFIGNVTAKYINLYQKITGQKFKPMDYRNVDEEIKKSVEEFFRY